MASGDGQGWWHRGGGIKNQRGMSEEGAVAIDCQRPPGAGLLARRSGRSGHPPDTNAYGYIILVYINIERECGESKREGWHSGRLVGKVTRAHKWRPYN